MNQNKKLSKLISGRSITDVVQSKNKNTLNVTLDDNSRMTIKTSGEVNKADLKGLKIDKVQQQDTTLRLIGTDNKTVDVTLDEATSSVIMRDKDGGFAYSD